MTDTDTDTDYREKADIFCSRQNISHIDNAKELEAVLKQVAEEAVSVRPAICAFCSWEGPASTTLEQIQAHSAVCEHHPLAKKLAALTEPVADEEVREALEFCDGPALARIVRAKTIELEAVKEQAREVIHGTEEDILAALEYSDEDGCCNDCCTPLVVLARAYRGKTAALKESEAKIATPIQLVMFCPAGHRHIDGGEWATKPHKTHRCQEEMECHPGEKQEICGLEWRPSNIPTVGVAPLEKP